MTNTVNKQFRRGLITVLAIGTLAASSPVRSQNVHIAHCLQGCPTGSAASNELLVRHLFAVSINSQARVADWVSYRIIPGSIGVASLLPRIWTDDDLMQGGLRTVEVDRGSAESSLPVVTNQQESSYRVSEFNFNPNDQGHLVPMTSFVHTSYWPDLNLLSVMSMMKPDMRLGAWSRLDQVVNQLVKDAGELYVLVGPVYNTDLAGLDTLNDSNIPAAYFKVIANSQGQVAAFIFEQSLAPHVDFCSQDESLNVIESLTGLNLFPQASDWPTGSLLGDLGCHQN